MSDTHPIVPLATPDLLEDVESIDGRAKGRGKDKTTASIDGLDKLRSTGKGGSQSPPGGGGDADSGGKGGGAKK